MAEMPAETRVEALHEAEFAAPEEVPKFEMKPTPDFGEEVGIIGVDLIRLSDEQSLDFIEDLFENIPVLVEAPLSLLADVGGPDGLEGTKTTGGFDVADNADADHGRGLDDGDGLDDLLLIDL